jgi:arsenite methyltransferase
MTMPNRPDVRRVDYGLDAPGVVRNLFLAAAVASTIDALAVTRIIPPVLVAHLGPLTLRLPLLGTGFGIAVSCAATAGWMIWTSKVGKVRERERLLDQIAWTGHERVLDVGCGRGPMLLGAARRLTTGTASGIDIWQAEDLTGNSREATLANAQLEDVAGRVDVQTADMRAMPFADATFDVVVSCVAIHNIYSADGRSQAIREIARVLKSGGRALIVDIRHHREYAATFRAHGCPDVRRVGSVLSRWFWTALTIGSVQPDTTIARRSA